jgi:hypothetical protein
MPGGHTRMQVRIYRMDSGVRRNDGMGTELNLSEIHGSL